MLDVHIDDFWKDCAAILLSGMRIFPRTQTLYIEDISGPDTVDEFGLHSDRHLAALGALQWLHDENYVRYGNLHRQDSVDDFALTSKSFTCLLKMADPDSFKDIPEQADNTPVFQVLEFALLQQDSLWLGRLMQQYIIN